MPQVAVVIKNSCSIDPSLHFTLNGPFSRFVDGMDIEFGRLLNESP